MKKILSLLVALSLSFTLVACNGKDTTPEDEKVFNWNIGADPKTLDPGLNGASDGGDVINQTFEGLVREKQGVIMPGMAESWNVSADGLTVTFNIRDDAKWSNGDPVTADDFVFSWLRGMDPRTASEYSWIWHYTNVVGANEFVDAEEGADYDALAAEVGIISKDNGKVLEVKLIQPTNWFVSLMAFYHFMPVPKDIVSDPEKAGEDGFWAKTPEYAISNGPFKLNSYTVGSGLQLVKNDEYWNAENVGIDVINGKFIDDSNTAYAQYIAQELDFIPSVPSAKVPQLIAESSEFYVYPLLGTYYINFNLNEDVEGYSDDLWDNAKLRKALALSIDREAICEALGAGQVPAGGFVPPGFSDHNGNDFFKEAGMYGFAIDNSKYEDAKTLFAEAAEEMGITEEELIAKLEEKTYLYNTSDGHKLVGELVQEMWKTNLGFTINLSNEEWAIFQVTRTEGRFDLARGGWLTDFMDPSGMLGIMVPGNAYNDAGYDNELFVEQMEIAKTATEASTHFEALYAAQEIFMNDVPVIPIYHYSDTMLASARIKGWSRSVLGSLDFSTATVNK